MTSKVNAKRIMENIEALADAQGISKKRLEQAAGVSTGYLSKLSKDGNKTIPNVEILHAIAEELGVSIDILLTTDLMEHSEAETYLLNFINKLIQDTQAGTLVWQAETPEELNRVEMMENDTPSHPLFLKDEDSGVLKYFSFFGEQEAAEINHTCYMAKLPNTLSAFLYIMNIDIQKNVISKGIKCIEPVRCLEMCLYDDGADPICRSDLERKGLQVAMMTLYEVIKIESGKRRIPEHTRFIIDQYMGDYPF